VLPISPGPFAATKDFAMTLTAPLSEEDACKMSFVTAIKDALNVVSGKWKLAIVCTLLRGPRRFNEIERLLNGLSPRMLARELRELEINGVVERVAALAPPASVHSYQLTASGKGLEAVIVGMATWGVEHRALSSSSGA
jgi:DNA-binding HxlR family transcriptional regulator